jgi:hypothetical protein
MNFRPSKLKNQLALPCGAPHRIHRSIDNLDRGRAATGTRQKLIGMPRPESSETLP